MRSCSADILVPVPHSFPFLGFPPLGRKVLILSSRLPSSRSDYLAIPSENKESSAVPVEE